MQSVFFVPTCSVYRRMLTWAAGGILFIQSSCSSLKPETAEKDPSPAALWLQEQVGEAVSLDGVIWSRNGNWWFSYEEEDLYLISKEGPQLEFPSDIHARKANVSGSLLQQLRPDLNGSSEAFVPSFVIRDPEIRYLEKPITLRARFGRIDPEFEHEDGVPLLIREQFPTHILNRQGWIELYADYNRNAVTWMFEHDSPQLRQVLVDRMENPFVHQDLRCLYATILAGMNDPRGREKLLWFLEEAEGREKLTFYGALGLFPYLPPESSQEDVEIRWAEQAMLTGFNDPQMAQFVVEYSYIAQLLTRIGSAAGKQALMEYALSHEERGAFLAPPSVIPLICEPSFQASSEELVRLEAHVEDSFLRRRILRALLRRKDPVIAEIFLEELEEAFFYMDIRDHASPEVVHALLQKFPELEGVSKAKVQILETLQQEDPVAGLLALLHTKSFREKALLLFELKRFHDPRTIEPVSELLQTARRSYFSASENGTGYGVEHGVDLLASMWTRESVQALIELLSVNLGRFRDSYRDDAALKRYVAVQLIEGSGESFGVDAAAWQAWERKQADSAFADPEKLAREAIFRLAPDQRVDMER